MPEEKVLSSPDVDQDARTNEDSVSGCMASFNKQYADQSIVGLPSAHGTPNVTIG